MTSQKRRILIVDDEESIRTLLSEMVRSFGYDAEQAWDGYEALAKVRRHIDLVLLDVTMPGMDGFAVARRIRQDAEAGTVPIVMITGMADKEHQLRAVEAGANDFIGKPIDANELRVRMTSLLKMKEAQDVQKRHHKELEDTHEGLEAFVSSMARDLDAPLRVIERSAQALLTDELPRLQPSGQEHLLKVLQAAQRMELLIKDLQQYSQLARAPMHLQPVGLNWVIPAVIAELRPAIEGKKAQVAIRQPLPPVVGHQATLGKVFHHLIANAVKFVAPTVCPQVTIWAEEREGWVRTWVEDNGIGIHVDHHERLFRAFERLHPIDAYPGTGIGLAIVMKGIERMGGRVGLESQPGKGSRFWVELRKPERKIE
jgi:light-regulated signal transduction histidine kinase (bacteriophytochrome)